MYTIIIHRKTYLIAKLTSDLFSIPQTVFHLPDNQNMTARYFMSKNKSHIVSRDTNKTLQFNPPPHSPPIACYLEKKRIYEHKIFLSSFARAHKNAKVFVVPGQFSFPVQLPNPLLGISNATELLDSSNPPPEKQPKEVIAAWP